MSLESAHQRAQLWLRQARDDLKAAQVLQRAGQAASELLDWAANRLSKPS